MTRLVLLMVAAAALGCSKPSEDDCRKAITNIQRLMGTASTLDDGRIESEVRRCKGGSKKKAVECAINAQTLDDLRKCEFFKVPANAPGIGTPPSGSANIVPPAGSAVPDPGSAGSAAAAPAEPGSAAAPGSAAGSAAPTGSAAGPGAAAGSAATGPGSAVGSAK
jgi:hypothetical protein